MQGMIFTADVGRRGGLALPPDVMQPEAGLLARLGGPDVVARTVDGLYDRIAADEVLRPMFRGNLEGERERQKAFFVEWLGGETGTSARYDGGGLRSRHEGLYISRDLAERWLGHFEASIQRAVSDPPAAAELSAGVRALAMALVNQPEPPAPGRRLRYCRPPGYSQVEALVRSDDGPTLSGILREALPAFGSWADALLQTAAALGKTRAMEVLLAHGIDPNRASNLSLSVPGHTSGALHHVLITPLCAALSKNRREAAEILTAHGALYDVFTAAYVGDLEVLRRLVDEDPAVAGARDPACDMSDVTPLHHAVYGGHTAAAAFLFSQGAVPGPHAVRLLRWAQQNEALCALLLQHGARAEGIGPGRWVMHPAIAESLHAHGADVNDPPGVWIWLSCTGNSGHKEDAEFVAALLRAGADVRATYAGASALHYAARAGFASVVSLLVEHGAEVAAEDRAGLKPIDWASAKGKEDVCRLLRGLG